MTFDTANVQFLDEQPSAAPNLQWVGFDPSTDGAVGISFLNAAGQFGRIYLSGRIRLCHPSVCPSFVLAVTKHEIGHTFGLENKTDCGSNPYSIMCTPVGNSTNPDITSCDNNAIASLYCPEPTPTPTPTPPLCEFQICDYPYEYWSWEECSCIPTYCPIVLDLDGDGFDLTSAQGGVNFDFNGDGISEILSWTAADSDDVWLVLDRNGNGVIDNGSELFGNAAPQPVTEEPHGFLALAEFDKPLNGGNADGQIDRRDRVFNRLRLWRDANHNGVSEPNELRRLIESPIRAFDLTSFTSRRTDEHGNEFRYRAIVRDERGYQVGRWAWDGFLRRYDPLDSYEVSQLTFGLSQASCGLVR